MEKLDLIDVGIDDSNFVMEFDDTIEYAISDYVSILYSFLYLITFCLY